MHTTCDSNCVGDSAHIKKCYVYATYVSEENAYLRSGVTVRDVDNSRALMVRVVVSKKITSEISIYMHIQIACGSVGFKRHGAGTSDLVRGRHLTIFFNILCACFHTHKLLHSIVGVPYRCIVLPISRRPVKALHTRDCDAYMTVRTMQVACVRAWSHCTQDALTDPTIILR